MTTEVGARIEPAARLEPAWTPALRGLVERAWRWRGRMLFCGCVAAGLGVGARAAFPGAYAASEQLLFDPQGLKVFDADAAPTRLDANAQIDFVESQMGLLTSERVLTRVLQRECDARADPPPQRFQRYCADGRPNAATAQALEALRRAYSVKRAERSFLVDVTAVAETPEFAARLASELVAGYIDEDAATRAAAAATLGAALNARIEALQQNLAEAEKQAQTYRRNEDLTTIGDKLLIELKLTDAAKGLDAAETRLQQADARVKQLEVTPADATGLGALGDEAETRPLGLLLERRAAARADLAPLSARLGARNPELIQARSRLASVEHDVARELGSIRAAAQALRLRAERERGTFARSVETLTAELNRARQSQIALKGLDQTMAANRKLLDNFESRSREVAESGRLDLANLRIASKAQAPAAHNLALGLAVFGAVGFLVGLGLALAVAAITAALALAYPAQAGSRDDAPDAEAAGLLRDFSRRMRAGG